MKKIIYEAYCNEMANDKFGATLVDGSRAYNNLFYFKNYKILNLSSKKYLIFYSCSRIFSYIWLISFFYFTSQFLFSIFIPKSKRVLKNVAFIDGEKSIYDIGLVDVENMEYIRKNFFDISSHLSWCDKILSYKTTIEVIIYIYQNKKNILKIQYNSLKLHIYDLYIMSLYCQIFKNKNINFFTNSHYERWTYIASKINDISLNIVQHGFLTKEISFPFKFGKINTLYVYSKDFVELFRYHYSDIKTVKMIKSKLNLKKIDSCEHKNIFIASSMVSVDLEKEIVCWLLLQEKYNVYIKLHPAYDYKDKFKQFKNNIKFINYFPKADIMICYNSFLGYEYESMGQKVVWIQKYKNNLRELYTELESKCVE